MSLTIDDFIINNNTQVFVPNDTTNIEMSSDVNAYTLIIEGYFLNDILDKDKPIKLLNSSGSIHYLSDTIPGTNINYINNDVISSIGNIVLPFDQNSFIQDIKDSFNIDSGNSEDCTTEDQPVETSEDNTMNLVDKDGNVVSTVSADVVNAAKYTSCNYQDDDPWKIIMDLKIPNNFTPEVNIDPNKTAEKISICDLPAGFPKKFKHYFDDNFKDKVNEAISPDTFTTINTEELLNKISEANTQLNNSYDSTVADKIIEDGYKDAMDGIQEEIQSKINDSRSSILPTRYLGIPIVNLNKEYNINIQILNKKLQVNLLADISMFSIDGVNDLPDLTLEIDDYEFKPSDYFYIGFSTNQFNHKLMLYVKSSSDSWDDAQYFEKEITSPLSLHPNYIGIDSYFIKRFCGVITNIALYSGTDVSLSNYMNYYLQFQYPSGAIAFYDWYKTRIHLNRVTPIYPSETLLPGSKPKKDVLQRGSIQPIYFNLNKNYQDILDYYFMVDTCLSGFFCRDRLLDTSFSISTWFYPRFQFAPEQQETSFILSDRLSQIYLKYNFKEKDEDGNDLPNNIELQYFCKESNEIKSQKLNFTFENNKWYNFNIVRDLRIQENKNKLFLIIIEKTDSGENIYEMHFDLDEICSFDFHMDIYLANKDHLDTPYDPFLCVQGTLAIYDYPITKEYILSKSVKDYFILEKLNPVIKDYILPQDNNFMI